jgi:hypothetical protein
MGFRLEVITAAIVLMAFNAQASERRRIVLSEDWHVKQVMSDKPMLGDLIEGLGNPADGWMAATMPAQVHDVLLAQGRIVDPHVSLPMPASGP